ncbi:MAG: magnesium and cobalt transport protein CorA [Deltaproteobacteria bacterium CG_4_8_14_3_um_filter_51_11]|nr:magnesium/cobalt transporter CorA [bacterium]OIP41622.1 MAG: magnesium and cobalt transport protein CorA [Desulfobacteraceae bacterium CG2_30_51_40]PIW01744.1 MAG: magnesium and cobalt transport protein CorA [Deltaproteobacteria bacterium CG17_big_fil_post_rev_8_21_14_2_50_51_6]PIX20770.1 MAG: magnesium and cobalt transport protein CorA [Deltaproteobacteria bacterium CG_4_8_14_3_um_filter_51_11]PIY21525.1 MAG: magnesium and cobalt transport protein CorA [Deltaproteobacteria bacterium CG_4_10
MRSITGGGLKSGLPPGSLIHVGIASEEEAQLTVIKFNPDSLHEVELVKPFNLESCIEGDTVSWINFCGIHDIATVAALGERLSIHPLVLEDIVNTRQRPKVEIYEGYIYIVLKMLSYDRVEARLDSEQVSLIMGPGYVVTFQERPGDVFDPVRQRLRAGRGRIRGSGPDYLTYALMDVIVDNYFIALEAIEDQIEGIEDELFSKPSSRLVATIHNLKRVMIVLRKAVWPLREILLGLERGESDVIKTSTVPYFRDVYDHSIQVIDTVESLRDVLSGYLDIYLTSVSNRMNEIMKVLTIMATIFIPLTFIAGIYGMNFDFMPELKWPWAYPALWGVMLVIGGGMIWIFRRKKWL